MYISIDVLVYVVHMGVCQSYVGDMELLNVLNTIYIYMYIVALYRIYMGVYPSHVVPYGTIECIIVYISYMYISHIYGRVPESRGCIWNH